MIVTKRQLETLLPTLSDQKKYELKEAKEKRSLTANAYFHVLISQIADAMKLSKIEVHNQMIADYGQVDEDVRTLILRDDIDWKRLDNIHLRPTTATRVLDDKKLYRVYHVMRGSHSYNKSEMAVLISGVVQEAQALNIETRTVSEHDKMIEEWGKTYARKMERD